jgi:glutamate racemase
LRVPSTTADAPIGVFDSGVGGLTVVRAMLAQTPQERLLYLGDTARGPYGDRPLSAVRAIALEVMDHLVESGVKALVIACNSASAAVLRDARERYALPVFEVVHPAVRSAVQTTRNGRVGVIGTAATIRSGAYDDAFVAAPHVTLVKQSCPRFVEFVEAGRLAGDEVLQVAHEYLAPLAMAGVDTLVLGCTHYPLLADVVTRVLGDGVALVSSADGVAADVARWLAASGLGRDVAMPPPRHRFLCTGDPVIFRERAARVVADLLHDIKPGAFRPTAPYDGFAAPAPAGPVPLLATGTAS